MEKIDGLNYHGIDCQIYGDKAYSMAQHFLVECPNAAPGSPEARLNKKMAVVRTCTSEWCYQVVKNTNQNPTTLCLPTSIPYPAR